MLIGENPIGSRPGIGESYVVRTKSYTMDQWTIFTGSEPIGEGEIRYHLNRNYGINILKSVPISFDMEYGASTTKNTSFPVFTSLKDTLRSITMATTLVPSYELTIPSMSVINALVWSWAEVFDGVWRKMDTMKNALKINFADDVYLDDAWGQIYDIPRIYQEDDTSYRDRLKTRTTILTSSGTKSNCETIINGLIEETDATTVTSRYPASVDITFNDIDAMRKAKAKQTVLNILIPQMLASGITYNMYLPFCDYIMDTYLKGPMTLSHTMVYALSRHNEDTSYSMYITNNIQSTIDYDQDMNIMDQYSKSYIIGSMLSLNNRTKQYNALIGLFGTQETNLPMTVRNKKFNILRNILISEYVKRFDINKTIEMTSLNKATLRRIYRLSTNFVNQLYLQYTSDVVLRLFTKSISIDVLNKRSFPKKYTMSITLAGA